MNQHTCIAELERPEDYVFGSSTGLEFKAVKDDADWSDILDFFTRQKITWESNGCVPFSAHHEAFDGQINHFIETGQFPQAAIDFFYGNGYMEISELDDNKPRFHSSPRFSHVLGGTKDNGTPLQLPWDIIRKQGMLPWSDLPFEEGLTHAQYYQPIPQASLDKAKKILQYVSISYQWISKGGKGTPITKMKNALKQAPLCIGTAVCEPWNQNQPPVCDSIAPEHSTMVYKMDTVTHILDHYPPFKKTLSFQYNIPYVFQGVVSVVPQAPAPLPQIPPVSNPATPQQKFDLLVWLGIVRQALVNWLHLDPKAFGAARSTKWPAVERAFKAQHSECAACGNKNLKELAVHHKFPFHLDPSRELLESNLIVLCGKGPINCHYLFGHCNLNWKCYNPNIEDDVHFTDRLRQHSIR